MADRQPPRPASAARLDAAGERQVLYCHQCTYEWYQNEQGLKCPVCEGEIVEMVTPESDPRPQPDAQMRPGLRDLRDHNPWGDSDDSDPEEADIEEHISHGPGGSIFISQTIRSNIRPRASGPRRGSSGGPHAGDPNDVMRDFQSMLGSLMGPGFRPGPSGRSGQDDLFPPAPMGFPLGAVGSAGGSGPVVGGGRFTYTTGRLHPRNVNGAQAPPDISTLIGTLFGGVQGPPAAAGDHDQGMQGGMPPLLQGLLATLLNPANARSGDAVYSQEALDQIISNLMEQHPTSNAPGPASPDAIAALSKKKLDEQLLGPEGKGECSVCMDDVKIGDEVVMLPCSHWFHEACAAAWLGEHNTCPICRKGIEGDTPPSATPPQTSRRTRENWHPAWLQPEYAPRRSPPGPQANSGRNEYRLDLIRNAGILIPTEESGPRRSPVVGDGAEYARPRPGDSFIATRRRDSEMTNENTRERRRANTSGSDQSRLSRQSSGSTSGANNNNSNHSSSGGGEGGSGPISWLRDRFSGGSDRARRD